MVRKDGDVLSRNVFYDQKELDLLINLLKSYEPTRLPKRHLANVALATYYSMQLLGNLEAHVVLGKKRRVAQRKKKPEEKKKPATTELLDENGQPRDPKVRSSDDPDPEDEKKAADDAAAAAAAGGDEKKADGADGGDGDDKPKPVYKRRESDFDFQKLVMAYAHPQVLKSYMYLYDSYLTNSAEVNVAIVDMFNRIAFDQRLPAMFWQIQFFTSYDRLLNDRDPRVKTDKSIERLRAWTKKIVRMFFDMTQKNKYGWTVPRAYSRPPAVTSPVCGCLIDWLID